MKALHPLALAIAVTAAVSGTAAADTIRVGVIGPMSGPFSIYGQNFRWGIDAWRHEHGDAVGDDTVEFVYRDLPGVDPAKARALAQELVVKDKVQYLAGGYFTPNALAITPLLEKAKTPFVVLNAATSSITESSPYVVRTSFTMWQNSVPAALAARDAGFEKTITIVSDYGPGVDAETAFTRTFTDKGGEIVNSLRLPLSTTDFNPIAQRIRDSGADSIFVFLPGGPPTLGFMKSYLENRLPEDGIRIISTGDVMTEPDLPALGDNGIGMPTTYHYSVTHDSDENRTFLAAVEAVSGDRDKTTMAAVAAYDGARLIYKMIEASGGERDPAAAMAAVVGSSWESPRGPVSIDERTRHITQNVYLREMRSVDGGFGNVEIDVYEAQPDWGLVTD